MSNRLFNIDISYQKHKKNENLITIKCENNDVLQINFTNFFIQSKYIQEKYKYSEAINFIQNELQQVKEKYNVNPKSIKLFIQLIQNEKSSIPIEHYRDFYTLSEYFRIQNCIDELDTVSQEELLKDINFTIQILFDSETTKSSLEKKLSSKIEKFLSERINDCFDNEKFGKLQISTIFRILKGSEQKSVNHDLLLDFILHSIESRFVLFKFIKFEKLTDEKVDEFIRFFEEKEEDSKNVYLEYIPFDLSFIKYLKNKYNNLFKEMNQTKHDFNHVKDELNKTNNEFNKTKQDLNNLKDELNKTNNEFNKTKQELKNSKDELNKTNNEFNKTKQELKNSKNELNRAKVEIEKTTIEHEQTKQELDLCKKELNRANVEINRMTSEMKNYSQTIIVAGDDRHNQLGEKSNSKNHNIPIISPPVNLSFDHSSLLSYSVYQFHAVMVTSDGLLKGVGNNNDGRISSSLQKTVIDHFTEFSIKDRSGHQLDPVSAVCYVYGTLYMFSKTSGKGRQLVLCDQDINGGAPVFLDIGNHHPLSLFGGGSHSSAICSEGEVIFINRSSVKKSPQTRIESVSLPDFEKASSVACCEDSVVVLSSNGRVFTSPVRNDSVLKFSEVLELKDKEIVSVSGTYEHVFAVSKEGRVFGRGSNGDGQLGLGKGIESSLSFTEISSLEGYEIMRAYAGGFHSLFETREGKILSCGYNPRGELLLSSGPGDNVYSPTETTIKSGATFCITGDGFSTVFIGSCPPRNMPNMRIDHYI